MSEIPPINSPAVNPCDPLRDLRDFARLFAARRRAWPMVPTIALSGRPFMIPCLPSGAPCALCLYSIIPCRACQSRCLGAYGPSAGGLGVSPPSLLHLVHMASPPLWLLGDRTFRSPVESSGAFVRGVDLPHAVEERINALIRVPHARSLSHFPSLPRSRVAPSASQEELYQHPPTNATPTPETLLGRAKQAA